MAVAHSKRLMGTACKATSADHAVIRVYDTTNWRPFGQPLAGHNLTVTRITFSPDDRHILTVSRDRTWRLFRLQADEGVWRLNIGFALHYVNALEQADIFPSLPTNHTAGLFGMVLGRPRATCSQQLRVIKWCVPHSRRKKNGLLT